VELGQVLGALPAPTDPRVLVGATTGDDAAVFRIAEDRALVATVDFFTPIVDGPEDFGAIAAANSLSDVYAMGARPLFALSLVGFPRDKLASGLLERIVAGGAAALAVAGVPVVGGHSIDDAEPKFGYAVTGEVHPERVVTNRGAAPGHLLYLTKPLCSGLVATAIKRGLCPPDLEQRAVALMRHLNRQASEAMLEAEVSAATDVTGYGLLGHLANLVPVELGLGAELRFPAVPVLEGVEELVAADLFPSGSRRNLQALEGRVEWDELTQPQRLLLCDAQTSGGLLVAVPPRRARRFEALMAEAPYPATQIGVVTDGPIRVSP
jgi:selenide,water dikinase